jgi:hypothetical protein
MRTLLLFGAIAFSFGLSAQCTVTITPSSDIIICNGASGVDSSVIIQSKRIVVQR